MTIYYYHSELSFYRKKDVFILYLNNFKKLYVFAESTSHSKVKPQISIIQIIEIDIDKL